MEYVADPVILAAVAGIVLFAYFVRGITGAGSGLIAIPVLVQFLPITLVVPTLLLLDFTASCLLSNSTKGQGDWSELKRLLPFSALGVVLGTLLLVKLHPVVLLGCLGLFTAFFGIRNIRAPLTDPISERWAKLAGRLGGAIGGVFGTGGPPYMIYLGRRIHDKSVLRATFSRLFLIEGAVRIVVFSLAGLLLRSDVLVLWLVSIPMLLVGLRAGGRVHLNISNRQMLKLVGILLVFSGLSLMAKAYLSAAAAG